MSPLRWQPGQKNSRAGPALGIAGTLVVLSVGLTLLAYRCPWGLNVVFGLNHAAPFLFGWSLWGREMDPLAPVAFALLGIFLVGGQWTVYGLAVRAVLQRKWIVPSGLLLMVPAVIGAIYLFMPPLFTTDTESYALMGRVWVVGGQNPYLVPPAPADPYFLFRPWSRTFVYGPLALLHTAATVRLVGSSLFPAVVGFKVTGAFLHILTAFLVGRAAEGVEAGRGAVATMLYGWNPLALFELAGNGHNESLVVVLLALALWLYTRGGRWRGVGFVVVVGSALVKYSTLPFALFYLVAWARSPEGREPRRGRVRLALGMVLALALVGGSFLALPVGSVLGALQGLQVEAALPRLAPLAWIPRLALGSALLSTADAGGESVQAAGVVLLGLWSAVLGGLLVLWQAGRLSRGAGDVPDLVAAWVVTTLVSLIMLSPSLFPWYLLWVLVPTAVVWWAPGPPCTGLTVAGVLGGVLMALYFVPV